MKLKVDLSRMDEEKMEELSKEAYEAAYKYEREYGNCPQCVIAAVQDVIGGIEGAIFKSAHALAGGGALKGSGTCGALTGGMMAISAFFGREREDFAKSNMKNYKIAKKLFERFEEEFGSPICTEVQKEVMGKSFDIWDPVDYREFEGEGGHDDKCPFVAASVAKWTVLLILSRGRARL